MSRSKEKKLSLKLQDPIFSNQNIDNSFVEKNQEINKNSTMTIQVILNSKILKKNYLNTGWYSFQQEFNDSMTILNST